MPHCIKSLLYFHSSKPTHRKKPDKGVPFRWYSPLVQWNGGAWYNVTASLFSIFVSTSDCPHCPRRPRLRTLQSTIFPPNHHSSSESQSRSNPQREWTPQLSESLRVSEVWRVLGSCIHHCWPVSERDAVYFRDLRSNKDRTMFADCFSEVSPVWGVFGSRLYGDQGCVSGVEG